MSRTLNTPQGPHTAAHVRKMRRAVKANPEWLARVRAGQRLRVGRKKPYWTLIDPVRVPLHDEIERLLTVRVCARCGEHDVITLTEINEEDRNGAARCRHCHLKYRWRLVKVGRRAATLALEFKQGRTISYVADDGTVERREQVA